jgi:hypothetical protein
VKNSGRVGLAELPLHSGLAPPWLFGRMVMLARDLGHVVADCGAGEVLGRLSDPFWFEAFGCVLGFDWHSSGVTTTTCGAIKEAVRGLEGDFGLYVAGGKGAASRKTPAEILAELDYLPLLRMPARHALLPEFDIDPRRLHWTLLSAFE